MKPTHSLLTLDRLRLAVSRNENAKRRVGPAQDNVDYAYNNVIRRDLLSVR